MSEVKHRWKAKSGQYAGFRKDDAFWNHNGEHVGIFRGDILYSSKTGLVIAKELPGEYLGKHSAGGAIGIYKYANYARYGMANRGSSGFAADDPDLD